MSLKQKKPQTSAANDLLGIMGDETPATSTVPAASTTAASSTSATNSLFDLIDTPAPAAVPAPQRNGAVMNGGAGGGLDDLLSSLGGVGISQQAHAPAPQASAFGACVY